MLATFALSQSPVVDNLMTYLSPGDITRYELVSLMTRETVVAWKRAAFNVNRPLGRFFHDPTSFRRLQARTGLLISGSFALQFLDR